MVYRSEGNSMKKKKSDALIQRLINNQISRLEFEVLLSGVEDQEMAIYLEESMKAHFDKIMKEHEEQSAKKERLRGKIQNGN